MSHGYYISSKFIRCKCKIVIFLRYSQLYVIYLYLPKCKPLTRILFLYNINKFMACYNKEYNIK